MPKYSVKSKLYLSYLDVRCIFCICVCSSTTWRLTLSRLVLLCMTSYFTHINNAQCVVFVKSWYKFRVCTECEMLCGYCSDTKSISVRSSSVYAILRQSLQMLPPDLPHVSHRLLCYWVNGWGKWSMWCQSCVYQLFTALKNPKQNWLPAFWQMIKNTQMIKQNTF